MKEKITISDIVLDESIYPRERIDRKRVSLFAENMRDGFSFDPIVVERLVQPSFLRIVYATCNRSAL
jgi:hypothetical protein